MIITFEIDENQVLEMLQGSYDDKITMKMVTDLVLKSEGVIAMIYMWGHDETETRSQCVDVLAKKFTGMSWPLYGDTDDYKKEFHAKWDKAMNKSTGEKNESN